VVFLVLESWRYDALSDSVTPHIRALARKSSDVRRHFSSGNATTTGIFGLLCGLHPTYWTAVRSNNAVLHNPLLIDLMQDAGSSPSTRQATITTPTRTPSASSSRSGRSTPCGSAVQARQARARARKAEIWFGDEAGIRSDAHAGNTWAPRGRTPIVSTTGARCGLNLISAVNRQGDFRFMGVPGRVNADVFLRFLQRLLQGMSRPIFLIVDGHPTHKAAKVRRFLETVGDRLELYCLPPCSPELNPDECVWNDLKNTALARKALTGSDQLKREVLGHLRHLQKPPGLIRSFFHAPSTADLPHVATSMRGSVWWLLRIGCSRNSTASFARVVREDLVARRRHGSTATHDTLDDPVEAHLSAPLSLAVVSRGMMSSRSCAERRPDPPVRRHLRRRAMLLVVHDAPWQRHPPRVSIGPQAQAGAAGRAFRHPVNCGTWGFRGERAPGTQS